MNGVFAMGLLLTSASPMAHAQTNEFHVDPARSQVQFSLPASLHEVHGTFHVADGALQFSTSQRSMSGSISVDARTGDTGERARDRKMTHDQLKADEYSTVDFRPKSYLGTLAAEGDSEITVQGELVLLGASHDLAVPIHVHIDRRTCTAKGSFAVPFTKWGVRDPSTFLLKVGKEVTVTLDLSGTLSSQTAQ